MALADSMRIAARLPWLAAQALRDLPAVHLGHGDVEQNEVRIGLLGQRQALAAGRGAHDVEAERRQQIADQLALHLVVVDDQDRLPRPGITAHAVFHRRSDARTRHLRQQKLDAERAALADLAADRDVAAHDLVSRLVIVRPNPVPIVALAPTVRARSKGWKIRSRSLLWMPTPVSSTVNSAT